MRYIVPLQGLRRSGREDPVRAPVRLSGSERLGGRSGLWFERGACFYNIRVFLENGAHLHLRATYFRN